MKPSLLPLLLGTLMTGCAVGPSFTVPESPAVTSYLAEPSPIAASATTSTAPPADWWALLQSAQLDAVVQLALANNQDLAVAQATLAEADALAGVSRSQRYPQVDFEAGAGRRKNGAATLGDQDFPAFTYYSIGPSVSYLFDFAGGVRRGIEQQRALAEYQAHQLNAARLSISGNVVLQALAVASARARIATVEALLADDDTDVQLVQAAFDAGSASRVDVLNAQSQRATDAAQLPPLRQQLSQAQHALALLVGKTPAQWQPPVFDLAEFALPAPLPVTVPSELAHSRPDIRAAEAQLHAATAAVGVSTANLYPQIRLKAAGSFEATALERLFDADSGAGALSVNLTAPIFNHGALLARQQAAIAGMNGARARYKQVLLRSFSQVADALLALEHNAELLDVLGNAQSTAAENLSLTRESYTAGNATVLHVLTAERQHQQAQLGLIQAQAEQKIATVQLLLALGGGTPTE